MKKNRYMLIDGNAMVHRGYHAVPPLSTKSGEQTNAVYGFLMILLRAIKELKPTHIACSFDLAGPTFRDEMYADYKATRVKGDQELYDQFPRVKEAVRALNIPIFEIEGFEADDVLGTLSTKICDLQKDKCDVMIVTGDLDSLQLVNECVKIYTLRKGVNDIAIYDISAVQKRFGLTPKQMIDYKALRGDPSDNIKGVKGIGEKTASSLIQEFGSVENLYKQIKSGKANELIKPRVLKLLVDGEESAKQSFDLSKIVCDVPINAEIERYKFTANDKKNILDIFQELEFRTLIDKLPRGYDVVDGDLKVEDVMVVPKEINKKGSVQSEPVKTGQPTNEIKKNLKKDKVSKQEYVLIDTISKARDFIKKIVSTGEFAVDTETDQLNPINANVIGASFSIQEGFAYYVTREVLDNCLELKELLTNSSRQKIGHNIKYDLLTLENVGINLEPQFFDTMVASYLLNSSSRQYSLDALAFNELGYQMQPIEDLIGKGKNQISMSEVDVQKVSWYASEDADITLRLKEIFAPLLKQEGLEKIFYNIEMPLIPVLARMERNGIKLDKLVLKKLSEKAEHEINELEEDIHKLAGEEFNINSPKQLGQVLFEKLGLTSVKKTKTGYSTSAEVLEQLGGEHKIIDKILSYRELTKLQSTYLLALPEMVNSKTGRIHTSYNQTIAATGRLSSTDPNLQNIPIRGHGIGSEVRQAFVAETGYKLVSVDYSQMELRIIAHLSGDENMLKVFQNNEDIHTYTASAVFDVLPGEVTEDMRRDAKTINFGILYGLSSFGLASRIGAVSRVDAKEFIDKYFSEYPEVKFYLEKIKAEVNQHAFIKNELGRIRRFPEIKSSQFFVRSAAERAAINFPIQSLQADILKIAMIQIHERIKSFPEEIKMLLQVHDELVFEIKADKVQYWTPIIQKIMVEAMKLTVPVTAEAKVGDNWGQMTKL